MQPSRVQKLIPSAMVTALAVGTADGTLVVSGEHNAGADAVTVSKSFPVVEKGIVTASVGLQRWPCVPT